MPDSDAPKTDKSKKDILLRLRERYKRAVEADRENRQRAMDNIKFANIPGEQWNETTKTERGKDRLMLEFNQIKVMCKRVINEERANRPQAKFLGSEDGDKKTSETISGMFRNDWNMSDGDSAADYQAEYQIYGGYGVFRLETRYSNDSGFDQDIVISGLHNPFCAWSDPAAKDMLKKSANWWIITEKITKDSYKTKYPNAEVVHFEDTEFDDDEEWEDDDMVRIAESWWKEPYNETLYLLADGSTVKTLLEGQVPVTQRDVVCYKVKMAICSGDAVLEGPTEFCCDEFPFVPVYGEYLVIDGKIRWSGMVETLKPAQQAYNSARTAIVEIMERAPLAMTWLTAEEADGHTNAYAEAHKKAFPVALYNATATGKGPQRVGGADVPVALIDSVQMAKEEMNSLAGFTFDPTATDAKNISGKALNARASAGQIATFNYPDNMSKAHKRIGEIYAKMVPNVYDSARIRRVLGADGTESFVKLNDIDPKTGKKVYDLSRMKFDVVVTTGPSFQTKRQEAAETLTAMAGQDEALMPTAGDLVYKSLDVPYADEIAERRRLMLPPPIQAHLNKDKELPPEVVAAQAEMAQQAEMVAQQGKLVEAAAAEAQEEVAKADKAKADLQIAAANLKTQQAQFDTHVAQVKLDLTKMAVDIDVKEMGVNHQAQENERASAETGEKKKGVDQLMAELNKPGLDIKEEFQEFLAEITEFIVSKADEVKARPKAVGVKAKRVNGKLVGAIDYDDGSTKTVEADRVNGELIGRIQ